MVYCAKVSWLLVDGLSHRLALERLYVESLVLGFEVLDFAK